MKVVVTLQSKFVHSPGSTRLPLLLSPRILLELGEGNEAVISCVASLSFSHDCKSGLGQHDSLRLSESCLDMLHLHLTEVVPVDA